MAKITGVASDERSEHALQPDTSSESSDRFSVRSPDGGKGPIRRKKKKIDASALLDDFYRRYPSERPSEYMKPPIPRALYVAKEPRVPRPPDLVLKCMSRVTGQKSSRMGVGWTNEDGSVTIEVDFPHKIEASSDMLWKLFPKDFKGEF